MIRSVALWFAGLSERRVIDYYVTRALIAFMLRKVNTISQKSLHMTHYPKCQLPSSSHAGFLRVFLSLHFCLIILPWHKCTMTLLTWQCDIFNSLSVCSWHAKQLANTSYCLSFTPWEGHDICFLYHVAFFSERAVRNACKACLPTENPQEKNARL